MGIIAGTTFDCLKIFWSFMKKSDPVEIDYKSLGTIAIDELKQAIWEDIEALKDQFGVSFVTGVKLVS